VGRRGLGRGLSHWSRPVTALRIAFRVPVSAPVPLHQPGVASETQGDSASIREVWILPAARYPRDGEQFGKLIAGEGV